MSLSASAPSSHLLALRRRSPAVLALASVLLAASASPLDADPVYRIVLLGDLGGNATVLSEAHAINDAGAVVGVSRAPTRFEATVFDVTGGGANLGLGTLGGDSSIAFDISNKGQIVGRARETSGVSAPNFATVFDPTGGGANVNLGTLGGGSSEARAVNDNSVIVGFAEIATGEDHAVRFEPGGSGVNKDLTPLSLGTRPSAALDVDPFGTAVGWYSPASFETWAASFATGGVTQMIDLQGFGFSFSRAWGVNAAGMPVGEALTSTSAGTKGRATLFDPTGGGANLNLGTIAGYANSVAYAINDSNVIVGQAFTGGAPNHQHAALFDATGTGAVDLNTLIDPADPLFGVFELLNAYDVNNQGQIVGFGAFTTGDTRWRAFLLNPAPAVPEPASLILLGSGLAWSVGVRARARRIRR